MSRILMGMAWQTCLSQTTNLRKIHFTATMAWELSATARSAPDWLESAAPMSDGERGLPILTRMDGWISLSQTVTSSITIDSPPSDNPPSSIATSEERDLKTFLHKRARGLVFHTMHEELPLGTWTTMGRRTWSFLNGMNRQLC